MKPTKEQIEKAQACCEVLASILEDGNEPGANAVRVLLAATTPDPGPPRPSNMVELARLVARELRSRGIWASATSVEPELCAVAVPTIHNGKAGFLRIHSLLFGQFDNLTPSEIADVIQAEEARKAQEWAGDT